MLYTIQQIVHNTTDWEEEKTEVKAEHTPSNLAQLLQSGPCDPMPLELGKQNLCCLNLQTNDKK